VSFQEKHAKFDGYLGLLVEVAFIHIAQNLLVLGVEEETHEPLLECFLLVAIAAFTFPVVANVEDAVTKPAAELALPLGGIGGPGWSRDRRKSGWHASGVHCSATSAWRANATGNARQF
jgi:hypothetical protein